MRVGERSHRVRNCSIGVKEVARDGAERDSTDSSGKSDGQKENSYTILAPPAIKFAWPIHTPKAHFRSCIDQASSRPMTVSYDCSYQTLLQSIAHPPQKIALIETTFGRTLAQRGWIESCPTYNRGDRHESGFLAPVPGYLAGEISAARTSIQRDPLGLSCNNYSLMPGLRASPSLARTFPFAPMLIEPNKASSGAIWFV